MNPSSEEAIFLGVLVSIGVLAITSALAVIAGAVSNLLRDGRENPYTDNVRGTYVPPPNAMPPPPPYKGVQ